MDYKQLILDAINPINKVLYGIEPVNPDKGKTTDEIYHEQSEADYQAREESK